MARIELRVGWSLLTIDGSGIRLGGLSRKSTALPKRLHIRLRDDDGCGTCGSDVDSHNRRRCAFFRSPGGVAANIPSSDCSDE